MDQKSPLTIGLILFPNLTQLDLTGPYEVFARIPEVNVRLVAASMEPVRSDRGLAILPDTTFANCPSLDILCVPGGNGANAELENEEMLGFLRRQSQNALYVTSVCTGSLLLAAAGLLDGYRATTHWLSLELLAKFGVEVMQERVVVDRNRITGSGVTAGIDFALTLAAQLKGERVAREIQLMLEYNPAPPFDSGSPHTVSPTLLREVKAQRKEVQMARMKAIEDLLNRRKATSSR